MNALIKIKIVFKKISCLAAGVFFFMNLSNNSFVQAEDKTGNVVVIDQRALEPVKCKNLENIKVTQETINFKELKRDINRSKAGFSSYKASELQGRPHISLKSDISAVTAPAEEKPKTNWIKDKIAVSGALLPAIENNQSPQLEKLKIQNKRRKASFEKSLKAMPFRESQLLKETTNGDDVKDNE